ncbi:MAG: M23 family metallopeptidase [Sphingomicrobium sp.]
MWALLGFAMPAAASDMAIQVYPPQPMVEPTAMGQAVNLDFEIINKGQETLTLSAIRAAVRSPDGAILQRLEVNDNGSAPGIETVPVRSWKPGEAHTLYNPFHILRPDLLLGRITFEFLFKDKNKKEISEQVTVEPRPYQQKVRLLLPLQGRVLVWDGHDFYSHHRRWNFSHPMIKQLGLLTNPARYSLDLVIVDGDGRFHSGDREKPENYPSFGATVVAPGDGTVVAAVGDSPNEPAEPNKAAFERSPMFAIYGNYIVIDHGNGEFSQLGHLKQASVRVKVGERVQRGQPIALAGRSGTSLFPHLHYQLTTTAGVDGEGLPARFEGLGKVSGKTADPAHSHWIDTGDIVETR